MYDLLNQKNWYRGIRSMRWQARITQQASLSSTWIFKNPHDRPHFKQKLLFQMKTTPLDKRRRP
jgi:hypothetical protein